MRPISELLTPDQLKSLISLQRQLPNLNRTPIIRTPSIQIPTPAEKARWIEKTKNEPVLKEIYRVVEEMFRMSEDLDESRRQPVRDGLEFWLEHRKGKES